MEPAINIHPGAGRRATAAADGSGQSGGGELLVLHPKPGRHGARSEPAVVEVSYGGRQFLARPSMADVFLTRAQRVIRSGETELVPLLHEGGLDLLLVSPAIAIGVRAVSE